MAAVVFDDLKGRFASEADYEYVVSVFAAATHAGDLTTVWANKRHLATLVSAANTKALMRDRLLARIFEEPGFLDEVSDRIENDEIVD